MIETPLLMLSDVKLGSVLPHKFPTSFFSFHHVVGKIIPSAYQLGLVRQAKGLGVSSWTAMDRWTDGRTDV